MQDPDIAVRELSYFREAGGRTIVDCTLPEMRRDVLAVAEVARAAEVNVIVVTGHYINPTTDAETKERSVDELTEEMIRGLRDGVDGTEIRSGRSSSA